MTNILNEVLNTQPKSAQTNTPSFINTKSSIKPLEAKGKLLPSKIFGSPIEYAKDIKQDIVNIGRAANGKSNDHELGRINDVSIKIGSLAIASYLFTKNPLKLNKIMQFAGFGSFFASMALLPKLLIQAPIKARTGVDVHQKYIDSQGRKKMMYQDPQYDLTDLYSREDLDKIGKKLKVDENLPDRDNFIKQRAKKLATQANTLWMMAAGASPILSALICCGTEKALDRGLEKGAMKSSKKALKTRIDNPTTLQQCKDKLAEKKLGQFIESHSDETMNNKMVDQFKKMICEGIDVPSVRSAAEKEIDAMNIKANLSLDLIKKAVKDKIPAETFENLSEKQIQELNAAIKNNSYQKISEILSKTVTNNPRQQSKASAEIYKLIQKGKQAADASTVSSSKEPLKCLNTRMTEFRNNKKLLDNYISSVIGDKPGTYIANQWGRFTNKALKTLNLSSKELKAVSEGNTQIIEEKLTQLASDEKAYNKAVTELMKMIGDYETKTGSEFINTIKEKADEICTKGRKGFNNEGTHTLGNQLTIAVSDKTGKAANIVEKQKIGSLENTIVKDAQERISGAGSSFYRFMQSLDIYKRANDGTLGTQIEEILTKQTKKPIKDIYGEEGAKEQIKKLVESCKKISVNASTSDYVGKFTTSNYNLSDLESKVVMEVLYGQDASKTLETSIKNRTKDLKNTALKDYVKSPKDLIDFLKGKLGISKGIEADKAAQSLEGFNAYKKESMEKLVNWENSLTPKLSHRKLTQEGTKSINGVERNTLVANPVKNMMQDASKKLYNSRSWLKLWGGIFAGVAVITLVTGLLLGRKDKTEKELEAQSKTNG